LLHGIVAPFLLIVISVAFYIIWIGIHNRHVSPAKVSA
jgi:hypothetical protein